MPGVGFSLLDIAGVLLPPPEDLPGAGAAWFRSFTWVQIAAITRMDFTAGGNYVAGTKFSLFGI